MSIGGESHQLFTGMSVRVVRKATCQQSKIEKYEYTALSAPCAELEHSEPWVMDTVLCLKN